MKKTLGTWQTDAAGLPQFTYTGPLPYRAVLPSGKAVKLPEDPWFLLGNYRLTLFAHASGEYEVISGQRAWARINQGEKLNSANVQATASFDGKSYALTGVSSLAADPDICSRTFGCGTAAWKYRLPGCTVKRSLRVKPSLTLEGGASAWELTIQAQNHSDHAVSWNYSEALGVRYQEIQFQAIPEEQQRVRYAYQAENDGKQARIVISGRTDDPLLMRNKEELSPCDVFPPTVFMQKTGEENQTKVLAEGRDLTFSVSADIMAGGSISRSVLIGFSYEEGAQGIAHVISEWEKDAAWEKIIPAYDKETDAALRRELKWHFYTLEAMATWSDYYKEVKIPQGTVYDYYWGVHASARDDLQHALPLVYDDPALAKSVLRYLMKRTTAHGEVRLIEKGFGYADQERYNTSDQQLYFFFLTAEYLRVTKDYAFLTETVNPYPVWNTAPVTVLQMIESAWMYLRDTVGTGPHGLVRLLNSDWGDVVYYMIPVKFDLVFLEGESLMNTAMALSLLPRLSQELDHAAHALPEIGETILPLLGSMDAYRKQIARAWEKDWGDRAFPARMYVSGHHYGEDQMYLEPMGYTLMMPDLPVARKKALYAEMKKRLYNGEKIGAREQERPEFESDHFEKGSRENGGIWYALNGPVILGLADVDREESERLLHNLTLKNAANQFPDYWCGYWSAADVIESSLIEEEGLSDQTEDYSAIPVYCAHPHAWVLYGWHYLKDN